MNKPNTSAKAPNDLPPKLRRLYEAARRLAAARTRALLWGNTARALADHKPKA